MPWRHTKPVLALCLIHAAMTVAHAEPPTDAHGDPLPRGAVARIGTVRFRHPDINGVAFSPDGKLLATSGSDDKVRLWDSMTGRELRCLDGHSQALFAVTFSPDGQLIASGSYDSKVLVWEVATGKERHIFKCSGAGVFKVVFSPDGKFLACSSRDLRVWDVVEGREVWGREGGGGREAVAFSPDGKLLVIGGSATIDVREVATGKVVKNLGGHDKSVWALLFTPNGSLISASDSQPVRLWDGTTEKELRRYGEGLKSAHCVALSADGGTLIIRDLSGLMHAFDVATGRESIQWQDDGSGLVHTAFSSDGKRLAAASGNTIRLWDVTTGKRLNSDPEPAEAAHHLNFTPDGKLLAACRSDGSVSLWDVRGRKERLRVVGPRTWSSLAAFAADGKTLVTEEGLEAKVRLWDVETGKELLFVKAGTQPRLQRVTSSPTGEFLAGWSEGEVAIWDLVKKREMRRITPGQDYAYGLAFSPEGSTLAIGGRPEAVSLWEIATGQRLRGFGRGTQAATFVTYSPDGRTIAAPGGPLPDGKVTGDPDGEVVLWEVATGKERLRICGHRQHIVTAEFSPDGRVVASAARNEPVRIWDALSGEEVRRLDGHRGIVHSLAFSSDGKWLATGGRDSTVLLWDATVLAPERDTPTAKLTPERLDALWAELASDDARRAYAAIRTLADSPHQVGPFLKTRLEGTPALASGEIGRLIADLDDERFPVREKASAELGRLGRLAEPALRQTLRMNPSAEVRRRIEKLLDGLPEGPGQEPLRLARTLEVLEHIGTDESRQVLSEIAKRGDKEPFARDAKAALQRLARRR